VNVSHVLVLTRKMDFEWKWEWKWKGRWTGLDWIGYSMCGGERRSTDAVMLPCLERVNIYELYEGVHYDL